MGSRPYKGWWSMFASNDKHLLESIENKNIEYHNSNTDQKQVSAGILVFIVFIAIIPQIYKLTLPTPELFTGFMSDDTFYYYKTAQNAASGLGFTFDGENWTNGFHPLWMAFCLGAAVLVKGQYEYLYLILSINLVFVFLFTAVVFRMFEKSLGLFFSCFLVFTMNWIVRSSNAYFSGLETPLALLLLCLSIQALATWDMSKPKNSLLVGCLIGLTVLARTEFLFVVPVAGIFILGVFWKKDKGLRIAPLVTMACAFIALTAPYFAYNYFMTGHLEQVSGLVKSAGSEVFKGWGTCTRSYAYYPISIVNGIWERPARINILLSFVIVMALFSGKYRASVGFTNDTRVRLLAGVSGLALLHHCISFGPCLLRDWHTAPYFLLFQVFWTSMLKDLYHFLQGRAKSALMLIMIAFLVSAFIQVPYYSNHWKTHNYNFSCPRNFRHEATEWIRDNLPDDARIGAWNAGYLGYFSGKNVINLDGYINGMELYEYLNDGRGVWNYIIDKKIDYLSDYYWGPPEPERSEIASRLERIKSFGKCETTRAGKPTFVDWYVWKIDYGAKH
jgi:hypothetical protein